MKRPLFIVIILSLALATSAQSANLLVNGSLDTYWGHWGGPGTVTTGVGWTMRQVTGWGHGATEKWVCDWQPTWQRTTDAPTVRGVPLSAHDAFRFTPYAGDGSTSEAIIYQDVPVTVGKKYTASVWVYLYDNVPGKWASNSGNYAALYLQLLNSSGSVIGTGAKVKALTAGSWTLLQRSVTVSSGTAKIRMNLQAVAIAMSYDEGHCVWDDAAFCEDSSAQTIWECKALPDGAAVTISGKLVSSSYDGLSYIQETNRTAGIKVMGTASAGGLAAVSGSMQTVDGERAIVPTSYVIQAGPGAPRPLHLNASAVSKGLSPIGLYVSVAGSVVSVQGAYMVITDGQGAVRVVHSTAAHRVPGDFVQATGALGKDANGPLVRAVSVRVLKGGGSPDPQWLQYRRDRRLTGRSPLTGTIGSPQVKWSFFIGGRENLVTVDIDGSSPGSLPLPASDFNTGSFETTYRAWGYGDPYYDLDGTGSLTLVPPNRDYKVGKFTTDPGLQKVEYESQFTKGTSSNWDVPVYGRLFKRSGGAWSQLWESQAIPLLFIANAIVGDFDNDGNLEAALVPWYDLWVLDMSTGGVKYTCRYMPDGAESGRGYGWLGAFDLNNDGKKEFVVVGDLENHVDVLGFSNGQLVRHWARLIERGVTNKQTTVHVLTNPVEDVNGDGIPEIVLSIYNENGDHRWHAQVIEGMTGNVILDIPDQCVIGLRDLNGDGAVDLLCSAGESQSVPDKGDLTVYSFAGGQLTELWQLSESSYQMQNVLDFPLHVNSSATSGRRAVLAGPIRAGGLPVFFTRDVLDMASGLTELTAWQANANGQIVSVGVMQAPYLEALAVRQSSPGSPCVLLRSTVPGNSGTTMETSGVTASRLASRRVGAPYSPAVVGQLTTGVQTVVVEGYGESLVAFQPPAGGAPANVLWRTPGRGMYYGGAMCGEWVLNGGVVMGDLLGNGSLAVVSATRSPSGSARLTATDQAGNLIWFRDFTEFPGAPPPWNVGGLTHWFAGHFTSPDHQDVLVLLRRGTVHSEEGYLLDGRTGEIIWHRTEGGYYQPGLQRAYGGGWIASFDYNGDGLDDPLIMNPDLIFIVNGLTNTVLLDRTTCYSVFPGAWPLYGNPVIDDFLGNGSLQFLWSGCSTLIGLTDLGGNALWSHGPANGMPSHVMQALGDIDGDGVRDLLSPGHRPPGTSGVMEFHCRSASTGALKWSITLPCLYATTTSPVVCDINGDGREECIFGADAVLYCIGASEDGLSGRILWSMPFNGWLGPPAVVDLEGNGSVQVVVVCSDGYVYGVGSSAQ